MENKELKDKIQKTVRENIAISAIKEEINMKKIKNKKIFYTVLSTAAMFMFCMVVIVGNKINVGKREKLDIVAKQDNKQNVENLRQENLKTELNINQIDEDGIGLTRIDADIQTIKLVELPKEFDFIKSIKLPEGYKLEDSYNIYVRSNREIAKYDKLHDYVFEYTKNSEDEIGNRIRVAFSKIGEPLRDYGIAENDKKSTIAGVEMSIYHSQEFKMYMAGFKCNDLYFDIETVDIAENELVELLESIVGEAKQVTVPVKDEDVRNIENPKEISNSKDYYAGKYVDNTGRNVVLLCEDTAENRAEICKELGITESNTIFKQAKYSYEYLTELQEKISKKMQSKELTFITTSSLMEDKNNIKVIVTTKDEKELEKLNELDIKGGAIEIEYSENPVAHEDLLVEKSN